MHFVYYGQAVYASEAEWATEENANLKEALSWKVIPSFWMKLAVKNQHDAKIVKEGGTPMQLNRPIKPDTTRRCGHCGQIGHMSEWFGVRGMRVVLMDVCRNEPQVPEVGRVQQRDAADACTYPSKQQCGTGECDESAATGWYGL